MALVPLRFPKARTVQKNNRYAMIIVMIRDQIKEILDRVLTWPPERQAYAASALAEMEAQDASPLRLNDEQVAEVKRRLADHNPKFVTLEEVRSASHNGGMRVTIREAAYDDLDRIYAWIARDRARSADAVTAAILEKHRTPRPLSIHRA